MNPWTKRLLAFGAVCAALGAISGLAGTVLPPPFRAWLFPVTWGGLQAWADEAVAKPITALRSAFTDIQIGLKELEIGNLENKLETVNSRKAMFEERLARNPADELIRLAVVDARDDYKVALGRIDLATCELRHLKGLGCAAP